MTDYTLMIAATTGVCSYVAGIVTMGWFTSVAIAEWRERWKDERELSKEARSVARALDITNRLQGRELAEYRASRQRSTAPLKLANAARKAKRLEREAAARELTNARHAEMRKIVGELV